MIFEPTMMANELARQYGFKNFHTKLELLHFPVGEKQEFEAIEYLFVVCPSELYDGGGMRFESELGVFHADSPSTISNAFVHTGKVVVENLSPSPQRMVIMKIMNEDRVEYKL